MDLSADRPALAFLGTRGIASGPLTEVARAAKTAAGRDPEATLLIMDSVTSEPIELDLRGSADDVVARLESPAEPGPRPPGRPRLGVVGREVTLLPRHWEWLASQPGGASVTLRKLVEEARRSGGDEDRKRRAAESAYRFISVMAGDEPGYEEATRALFAGDGARFDNLAEAWPEDVRDHARALAAAAL